MNQINFHKIALEKLGMTFTTASKETPTDPYVPLENSSFISREFRRFDERLDVRVGALPLDRAKEIALWVRTRDPVELPGAFKQVVEASLREVFFHGREEFEEWKRQCNNSLNKRGIEPSSLTFDGLVSDWQKKL